MQQDFVFDFDNDILNNGFHGEVRIIQNIDNHDEKLIAKIYKNPQDPNYIKEKRILETLTDAGNNENILHLLPGDNIHLIFMLEGYPAATEYLLFDYYQHEKLSKYLYIKLIPQDENVIKYLIYKIIRAVNTIHQNNIVHGNLNTNNIMFNNDFEPIIIHFVDSSDNINNNQYFVDYKNLAKIIINIITFGKTVEIICEKNKFQFKIDTNSYDKENKEKFCNSLENQLSEEFNNNIINIIIELMENNHLNLDNIL